MRTSPSSTKGTRSANGATLARRLPAQQAPARQRGGAIEGQRQRE